MRIRTIKPEFWVSESVGRLSRNARLLFIGLWSFADDSGRGRGAFPAISGTLFPYDPEAKDKLPEWFAELEREGMVRRYEVGGNFYYDIPQWLEHQKIEKPSKSKYPPFPEHSPNIPRTLPDISALEQGTGNREKEQGGEGSGKSARAPEPIASRPVEPPPGMPRSEQEAVDIGAMAGVEPELCRLKYAEAESVGFVDWKGRPIRNFRSWLVVEKNAKVSREAEKKANPPKTSYHERPWRKGEAVPPKDQPPDKSNPLLWREWCDTHYNVGYAPGETKEEYRARTF